MDSAFGVDHGEVSKARLIPKYKRSNISEEGFVGRHVERDPSLFLKEKAKFKGSDNGIPVFSRGGGGLTGAGKAAVGVGAVGSGGTAVGVHRKRKGSNG